MTNLVESILIISKIDNGRLKLNRIEIDLNDFLSEQTEVFKGNLKEKLLLMAEAEKGIKAWVDPDLLIRIFQNVISNCMRYAETRVDIRLELDGQWAVIIVKDDGPGIAEKDLPHIFERYYQGKNGNYGIGLSVVLTGMQYLGGKVSVSNREAPGHGALYQLYLPVFETSRS